MRRPDSINEVWIVKRKIFFYQKVNQRLIIRISTVLRVQVAEFRDRIRYYAIMQVP